LKENLWLCLTCGNLGCGRAQYGGIGGNGHALKHFEATGHPIAVKMGSITPEGTADVFCYEHGFEILNPYLGQHLAHFGINILQQEKTQKSIAELVRIDSQAIRAKFEI
jgi:ubiquitin carboxyl-terminal hydrolase 5/13